MPTTARRTNNHPRTTSNRTPKHRTPIGLQLAVKALDGQDRDGAALRQKLETADRLAADLLFDPLVELQAEGPGWAIARLAAEWGAGETEKRLAAAIPPSLTRDPVSMITDHVVPWQDAGLYLGLCLGFRIAAGIGWKE